MFVCCVAVCCVAVLLCVCVCALCDACFVCVLLLSDRDGMIDLVRELYERQKGGQPQPQPQMGAQLQVNAPPVYGAGHVATAPAGYGAPAVATHTAAAVYAAPAAAAAHAPSFAPAPAPASSGLRIFVARATDPTAFQIITHFEPRLGLYGLSTLVAAQFHDAGARYEFTLADVGAPINDTSAIRDGDKLIATQSIWVCVVSSG